MKVTSAKKFDKNRPSVAVASFTKAAVAPLVMHCCNKQRDDTCLGAFFRVNEKGEVVHFFSKEHGDKPCAVLEGRACDHFERTILPLVDRLDRGKYAQKANIWDKARNTYLQGLRPSDVKDGPDGHLGEKSGHDQGQETSHA